jgi:signal transduction histidine kinase/DNA-binding response OmpR family regulator
MLKAAGHTITIVEDALQAPELLQAADPDLVLGASSFGFEGPEPIVRDLRRALGREVMLLQVLGREDGSPPPEVDDVIREPVDPRELNLRVRLAVRVQAERRLLHSRNEEMATWSQSSWTPSLAGGSEALFGQITRHAAQTLRTEKGLVLLYDAERHEMIAQSPGVGLDRATVAKLHYPVQGEASQRWNFRLNGPLLTNEAATDPRLMPGFVASIGLHSLLMTPILAGPQIIGLLAVADRPASLPFRDEDLATLQLVAGQASVAVDNHRLHEQLKGANLRLQEFDRLKSEFVAMVAHDFRSPLMAIRGFAEMVLEDSDLGADNRKVFVQTIINETDDLARLATDTFLITQMETGQFTYHWTEIELGSFILDALSRGRADHPVGLDVPAGLPRVTADPERLRQLLTNLISNAVKYSPGGDSVLVRARQPAGGHVQIDVVDHGLGIPHDQMNRLFQKFERVRTEQHSRIAGTGLGLYICRLIVEGHSGRIWAESEPGLGSTFSVLLPLDPRKTRPAST